MLHILWWRRADGTGGQLEFENQDKSFFIIVLGLALHVDSALCTPKAATS